MTALPRRCGRRPRPALPAAAAARRPGRCLQSRPRHRRPARHRRTPAPGHGHHRLPGPAQRPAARGKRAPATRCEQGTGSLTFTGPVTASTVRKLACDADIIPVVLGGEGQVLDIGRASRVFPPHVRKALVSPGPGLRLPAMHHPRALVRGPPHRLLVPGRQHRHGQRDAAVLAPPPPDPQRTVVHPDAQRHTLVHPAAARRPRPGTPPNTYFRLDSRRISSLQWSAVPSTARPEVRHRCRQAQ